MRDGLIHDWNCQAPPKLQPKVLDETLRDGLQSASVRDPSIAEKLALLYAMVDVGVDAANIGMPMARPKQQEHALRLAIEVAMQRLPIGVACAARTRIEDIAAVADVSQKAGVRVEVGIFVGASPIRQYVDGRTLADLQRMTEESVGFARSHQLPVLFVTEDTTRSTPHVLRLLYATAIRAGAERVCIADTVGHATPAGAARIVSFVSELVAELDPRVRIDWHGHRDRGLSVGNSLAAWAAGAERCHGTALGVGERSGNTPMELLLVNLRLLGWIDRDLHMLPAYAALASRVLGMPAPRDWPVASTVRRQDQHGVSSSSWLEPSLGRAKTDTSVAEGEELADVSVFDWAGRRAV